VLIIDDEPSILRVLALTLGSELEVVTASSATEGLDMLDEGRVHPSVVLSDLRLPDLDGISVLERVRATHPRAARLLMSGHADSRDVAAALDAGADQVLLKPFPSSAVRDAVSAAAALVRPAPLDTAFETAVNETVGWLRRAQADSDDGLALGRARARVVADLRGPEDRSVAGLRAIHAALDPADDREPPLDEPGAELVRLAAAVVAGVGPDGDHAAMVRAYAATDACSPEVRALIEAWGARPLGSGPTECQLTDVPAGSLLAVHLCTRNGHVLATRGDVLSEARLARLSDSQVATSAAAVVHLST